MIITEENIEIAKITEIDHQISIMGKISHQISYKINQNPPNVNVSTLIFGALAVVVARIEAEAEEITIVKIVILGSSITNINLHRHNSIRMCHIMINR